ncbi:MAG: bifunctional methylenetetrahydrofolate dehydrogenase/methenyltetrahydrofolate cyclohydrolase FolD [Planctomycetota bacterium]
MTAQIIDGKAISKTIQADIKNEVATFTGDTGVVPMLAAVLVGDDPASAVYVRNKEKACARAGITSKLHRLPASTDTGTLLELIDQLNNDPEVSGILVQLPLPDQIDTQKALDFVSPEKDVDAFHPHNVGLISQGRPRFLPCTPHGIVQMLAQSGLTTQGKHVVVVGRSDIVGKPMGLMLVQKDCALGPDLCNATVTICHSRTADLKSFTLQADVLVAAIGRANFITADMIKPGAIVIDVGINRTDDGLVGDVEFGPASEVASHITPVPGGVGRLTVTMLLANTLEAARQQYASGRENAAV